MKQIKRKSFLFLNSFIQLNKKFILFERLFLMQKKKVDHIIKIRIIKMTFVVIKK